MSVNLTGLDFRPYFPPSGFASAGYKEGECGISVSRVTTSGGKLLERTIASMPYLCGFPETFCWLQDVGLDGPVLIQHGSFLSGEEPELSGRENTCLVCRRWQFNPWHLQLAGRQCERP